MAKFSYIQNNFLKGEWSKFAQGKAGDEGYVSAADELRNVIVLTSGGVTRRPGTQFAMDIPAELAAEITAATVGGSYGPLHQAVSNYTNVRSFPFIFSREEVYEVLIIANSLTFSNIDRQAYTVVIDTFAEEIVHIDEHPALDAASGFYRVGELHSTQSGDTLVFCGGNFVPFLLQRSTSISGSTIFTGNYLNAPGTALLNGSNAAYLNVNATTTKIKSSATTGNVTLTATTGIFKNIMASPPPSSGAATYIRFSDSGVTGYAYITGVTSATVASATVTPGFPLPAAAAAGTGITDWAFNAFSNYAGFPTTCTFFQERLVYGGTKIAPDTSYFSALGNIYDFNSHVTTPLATSPMAFTPASGEVNEIQWYSSGKALNMGTLGREYIISSADPSNPGIAFNNISAQAQTSFGSNNVEPVRADNSPIFVDGTGLTLREFTFNFDEDNFRAEDIVENMDHLVKLSMEANEANLGTAYSRLAYQVFYDCLWCLDVNGYLTSITRSRQSKIVAGSRHVLGGNFGGSFPVVLSINALPSLVSGVDNIYLVVKRTINAVTKIYLERIGTDYLPKNIITSDVSAPRLSKPFYLDSSVYVNNSPASTAVAGLAHLEGETVDVFADGFYEGQKTVTAGAITLATAASHIVVGLRYRSLVKPLELEFGSKIGSAIGSPKRIDQVKIKFVRTIGAKIGVDEDNLEDIEFRPADLAMNVPTPLFTGTKTIELAANYDSTEVPIIVQDLPFPFSISCIVMRGVTYD